METHERMRSLSEGKGLGSVKVLDGSAEEMRGVEKGWVDAVIVAQVGIVSRMEEVRKRANGGWGLHRHFIWYDLDLCVLAMGALTKASGRYVKDEALQEIYSTGLDVDC
jgi:hypothetical protein